MDPGNRFVRIGLSLCVCLLALATMEGVEAKKKEILTITGKIRGAEMRDGKIVTVYIVDAEHGEFILLRGTDQGKKLLKQIGHTVRATGYIGEALRESEFEKYIDVLEYELLPEDESPDESP